MNGEDPILAKLNGKKGQPTVDTVTEPDPILQKLNQGLKKNDTTPVGQEITGSASVTPAVQPGKPLEKSTEGRTSDKTRPSTPITSFVTGLFATVADQYPEINYLDKAYRERTRDFDQELISKYIKEQQSKGRVVLPSGGRDKILQEAKNTYYKSDKSYQEAKYDFNNLTKAEAIGGLMQAQRQAKEREQKLGTYITETSKITGTGSAIEYAFGKAGEFLGQLPLSAATLGASSKVMERAYAYQEMIGALADEYKISEKDVIMRDLDKDILEYADNVGTINMALEQVGLLTGLGVAAKPLISKFAAKMLSKAPKDAAKKEIKKTALKAFLTGTGEVVGASNVEAFTEGLQEISTMYQTQLSLKKSPEEAWRFVEDNADRVIESYYAGLAGSVIMTGGGRVLSESVIKKPTDKAAENIEPKKPIHEVIRDQTKAVTTNDLFSAEKAAEAIQARIDKDPEPPATGGATVIEPTKQPTEEVQDALPKFSSGLILQREPEETGEAGSGRRQVEQGVEGTEVAETQEEESADQQGVDWRIGEPKDVTVAKPEPPKRLEITDAQASEYFSARSQVGERNAVNQVAEKYELEGLDTDEFRREANRKFLEGDLPKKKFGKKELIDSDYLPTGEINVKPIQVKTKKTTPEKSLKNIAANDALRPNISNTVFYDAKNKVMVSTDGHKLLVIPNDAIKTTELRDLDTGQVIDEKFPDYPNVIPKSSSIHIKLNVQDALNQNAGLARANEFMTQRYGASGSGNLPLTSHIKIGDQSFYFNPKFFSDMLKAFAENGVDEVTIGLTKPNKAAVFKGNGITGLLMPVMHYEEGSYKTIYSGQLTPEELATKTKEEIVALESDREYHVGKLQEEKEGDGLLAEYHQDKINEIDKQIQELKGEKKEPEKVTPKQPSVSIKKESPIIEQGKSLKSEAQDLKDQWMTKRGTWKKNTPQDVLQRAQEIQAEYDELNKEYIKQGTRPLEGLPIAGRLARLSELQNQAAEFFDEETGKLVDNMDKDQAQANYDEQLKINEQDYMEDRDSIMAETRLDKHITELNDQFEGLPVKKVDPGDYAAKVANERRAVKYTPARDLPTEGRAIEKRFGDYLKDNYLEARDRYLGMFGHMLNVDKARELSKDYEKDRSISAAVHEPASGFIKKLYDDLLEDASQGVLFTAGGTGAGKTTSAATDPAVDIIYDGNLDSFKSATQKIDKALEKGLSVTIQYTYRNPLEAFQNGVIPRMLNPKSESFGRTVPLDAHIKTHIGSYETIKRLAEHYKDNDLVDIRVYDNSRGKGNAAEITIAELPEFPYTAKELEKQLNEHIETLYGEGTITEAQYNAFTGRSPEMGGRPKQEGGQEAKREGTGGRPISQKEQPVSVSQEEEITLPEELRAREVKISIPSLNYTFESIQAGEAFDTLDATRKRLRKFVDCLSK